MPHGGPGDLPDLNIPEWPGSGIVPLPPASPTPVPSTPTPTTPAPPGGGVPLDGGMAPGEVPAKNPRRFHTFQRGDTPSQWEAWKDAREIWVDARAQVWVSEQDNDGNNKVIDISRDIMGGSIGRKRNAATRLSITIANEADEDKVGKYDQVFIPMDRIRVWLRRGATEWTAFTGYISRNPYYQAIGQEELTLEAECIIRRFSQKQWDPNLPENILALSSGIPEGGFSPPSEKAPGSQEKESEEGEGEGDDAQKGTGAEDPATDKQSYLDHIDDKIANDPDLTEEDKAELERLRDAIEAEQNNDTEALLPLYREVDDIIGVPPPSDATAGTIAGAIWPEQTLAHLMLAEEHLNLKPENVFIQRFPNQWKRRAAEITEANKGVCPVPWRELINCPDGTGEEDCNPGTTGGSPGDDASQAELAKWMADAAEKRGMPGALPVAVSLHEHRGNMQNIPQHGCDTADTNFEDGSPGCAYGYFQQTPDAGWGTIEQVMDPEYALNAFLDAAEAFKGQYGDDCESIAAWGQAVQKAGVVDDMVGYCEQAKQLIGESGGANYEGRETKPSPTPCGTGGGGAKSGPYGVEEGYMLYPYEPNAGDPHIGVDIQSRKGIGAKIIAVAPGEVADHGDYQGCGCCSVFIKYDNGPYVHYCHNNAAHVTPGERVDNGTHIADIGCEGLCQQTSPDNPHAHIQASGTLEDLLYNVNPLDPAEVFSKLMGGDPMLGQSSDIGGSPEDLTGEYGDKPEAKSLEVAPDARIRMSEGGRVMQPPNKMVRYAIHRFQQTLGGPYNWGVGHGDDTSVVEVRTKGADAAGLFNIVRKDMGLPDPEIGSFQEYFNFLTKKREFVLGTIYAPGTVLINPGNTGMGHIAMVYTWDQRVYESYGARGVSGDRTVREANSGWEGFTHVGEMPDIGLLITGGTERSTIEADDHGHGPSRRTAPGTREQLMRGVAGEEDVPAHILLGAEHHNVEPYIKQRADEIASKFGVYWNTYYGHGEPGGSWEAVTVDFWNGYRGGDIGKETGRQVADYALSTYGSDMMYMIWDGWMYRAGGGFAFPEDPHPDHPHVSWGGGGVEPQNGLGGGGSGNTKEGGGGKGAGSGAAKSNEAPEPCIMRHPLGVFRLQTVMTGHNQSVWTRNAALKDGDFMASDNAKQFTNGELGFDKYPDAIARRSKEKRDWKQLAELLKVPYMQAVKDVAASGLYTFNSMGTGEVVFWYPDFIIKLEDYMMKPDPTVGMSPEERRVYLDGLTPEARLEYFRGLSKNQIKERAPWLSEKEIDTIVATLRDKPPPGSEKREIEDVKLWDEGYATTPLNTENVDHLTRPMNVEDIELVDFHMYVSDDELVTHMYVMGDYRLEGQAHPPMHYEIVCQRWSTIFTHPYLNQNSNGWAFDPDAFIHRYGSRTKKITIPAIKTPGLAQLWADNEFLKHWLNCFRIDLKIAFMPELYPGMKLRIKSLGIQVTVLEVDHTFGTNWTTSVACSAPVRMDGHEVKIPYLPFWFLGNEEDQRITPEESIKPLPVGLENETGPATPPTFEHDDYKKEIEEWLERQRQHDARTKKYLEDFKKGMENMENVQ